MNLHNLKIDCIPALVDNYIWFIHDDHNIIIIDPGESDGILSYIEQHNLNLTMILLTHDHYDHCGGVPDIVKIFNVPVYGMCDVASNKVAPNDVITLDNCNIQVIHTPGHTYNSVCYLLKYNGNEHLFCGDTLFAAGCGKVFTGDYLAMFESLKLLSTLNTLCHLYPGHEYTLKNLEFAQFLEPTNQNIMQRIILEQDKFKRVKNTLPVTLDIELTTNPFLRCQDVIFVNNIRHIIGQSVQAGYDCFLQLRHFKNTF